MTANSFYLNSLDMQQLRINLCCATDIRMFVGFRHERKQALTESKNKLAAKNITSKNVQQMARKKTNAS